MGSAWVLKELQKDVEREICEQQAISSLRLPPPWPNWKGIANRSLLVHVNQTLLALIDTETSEGTKHYACL